MGEHADDTIDSHWPDDYERDADDDLFAHEDERQGPTVGSKRVEPTTLDYSQVGTLPELARVIRVGGWRNIAVVGSPGVAGWVVKAIRNKVGRAHVSAGGVNALRDLIVCVNGAPLPETEISHKAQVLAVYLPDDHGNAVFWANPRAIYEK